jgi:hypothetical protein
MSTSMQDLIVTPDSVHIGVLFPTRPEKFMISRPLTAAKERISLGTNAYPQASAPDQRVVHKDLLVRLPSVRESKWKVTVLQRWIGRVEHLKTDRFLAVLTDATNSQNPPEQVELEREEVSKSDLPLLAEGASFYWSIGYRDTPGGQRDRISTLRFARQPHLRKADLERIFERADLSAAVLQRE